jgi:hypothetical protein
MSIVPVKIEGIFLATKTIAQVLAIGDSPTDLKYVSTKTQEA